MHWEVLLNLQKPANWRAPKESVRKHCTPRLPMSSLFHELKRRNVYKVAIAYAVVAWLLIQAASILFPTFEAPAWVMKVFVAVLALGLPVALIIAWAFEMTPQGMKRTEELSPHEIIPQWSRRKFVVFIASVALLAGGLLVFQLLRMGLPSPGAEPLTNNKSIAVLPFASLSEDKANAYFADGIQDEILTRLSKIGELKVISRISTQRYKSSPEDLPGIARQLGVAHVLEGSVQKAGESVRVSVQLIRAATDSHVWAETYDRKLTDLFAVESEIAEKIAKSLRAKLTPVEQEAVATKPTDNPEAYEAYLRGLALWNKLAGSPQNLDEMVKVFSQAVQRDPNFALAWSSLSVAHMFVYAEFDATLPRLASAKEALDRAIALQPDLGEVYFAQGMYLYRGQRDFQAALAAFEKARQRSAKRVPAIEFSAYVKRREGKWEEALQLHEESLELDPRNPILLSETALSYRSLRRFNEAHALVKRALEIEPNNLTLLAQDAEIFEAEGDMAAADRLVERLPVGGRDPLIFGQRVHHWILTHRFPDAIRALRDVLATPERLPAGYLPTYRAWLGTVEGLAGNATGAREELSRARDELAAMRARGDSGIHVANSLILTNALLGDKPEVDRLAVELRSEIESDAVAGPEMDTTLAMARAHLGEIDTAIGAVDRLLDTPGELTPALLRLDPLWDPIRNDPRFQRLAGKL